MFNTLIAALWHCQQSALQLSEVLKEREAQIAFKNKRDELYKMQDEAYARYQEEERERGKMADMQSAEERNRAKAEVAKFQLTQLVVFCDMGRSLLYTG